MRAMVFAAALLSAVPAMAQQAPPGPDLVQPQAMPPRPGAGLPGANLEQDWMSLTVQLRHVGEQMQAYVTAAQRLSGRMEAVDAYWKAWCGEAPGCAVGAKP